VPFFLEKFLPAIKKEFQNIYTLDLMTKKFLRLG